MAQQDDRQVVRVVHTQSLCYKRLSAECVKRAKEMVQGSESERQSERQTGIFKTTDPPS